MDKFLTIHLHLGRGSFPSAIQALGMRLPEGESLVWLDSELGTLASFWEVLTLKAYQDLPIVGWGGMRSHLFLSLFQRTWVHHLVPTRRPVIPIYRTPWLIDVEQIWCLASGGPMDLYTVARMLGIKGGKQGGYYEALKDGDVKLQRSILEEEVSIISEIYNLIRLDRIDERNEQTQSNQKSEPGSLLSTPGPHTTTA